MFGGQFVTFDGTPSLALITCNSYVDLVSHVFDVYVGDLYNAPLLALLRLDLSAGLVSANQTGNPLLYIVNRDTGGAELDLLYSGTNFGEIFDWRFNACNHAGVRYDGAVSLHNGARGPSFNLADSLSLQSDPESTTTFTGMSQRWNSQTSFFGNINSWDTTAFVLSSHTLDDELSIDEMTSSFVYGDTSGGVDRARLQGGFILRSGLADGASLIASTPVQFADELIRLPLTTGSACEPPDNMSATGKSRLEKIERQA